jgi:short-subunit dehydrogenase
MDNLQLRDRWVVVTGASAGLGRAMARQLAYEYGANVALVARRGGRLRVLADEIERETEARVCIIEADLTVPQDVDRVFERTRELGDLAAVILNAGITHFGHHSELSWQALQALLQTNVTSVLRLSSLYTSHWLEGGATRGTPGLMIVSSMAGLTPVPYQAAYAGTKALLANFGRSLNHELRAQGISVTTFAPGGIDTELTQSNGLSRYFDSSLAMMDAESCARMGLRALSRRRELYVPGLLNQAGWLLSRWLPYSFVSHAVATTYRRALRSARADASPVARLRG